MGRELLIKSSKLTCLAKKKKKNATWFPLAVRTMVDVGCWAKHPGRTYDVDSVLVKEKDMPQTTYPH